MTYIDGIDLGHTPSKHTLTQTWSMCALQSKISYRNDSNIPIVWRARLLLINTWSRGLNTSHELTHVLVHDDCELRHWKQKDRQFENFVVIGGNLRCHRWSQSCQRTGNNGSVMWKAFPCPHIIMVQNHLKMWHYTNSCDDCKKVWQGCNRNAELNIVAVSAFLLLPIKFDFFRDTGR